MHHDMCSKQSIVRCQYYERCIGTKGLSIHITMGGTLQHANKYGNFCVSIHVAKLWTMVNPCLAHAGCTPNLSLPESHSDQILIIGLYNRYDILVMEIPGPAICCSVKCSLLVYRVTENIIKKRALKIYTSVS